MFTVVLGLLGLFKHHSLPDHITHLSKLYLVSRPLEDRTVGTYYYSRRLLEVPPSFLPVGEHLRSLNIRAYLDLAKMSHSANRCFIKIVLAEKDSQAIPCLKPEEVDELPLALLDALYENGDVEDHNDLKVIAIEDRTASLLIHLCIGFYINGELDFENVEIYDSTGRSLLYIQEGHKEASTPTTTQAGKTSSISN